MKNKFLIFCTFSFIFLISTFSNANDDFNFDVTEIEITNEGNFFRGLKRGKVETDNGNTVILADTFEYDKITNILNAKGNVIIEDKSNNYKVFSNNITYFKNTENIFSKGATIATIESLYKINSEDINLDKIKNVITTSKKTKIYDDQFTLYETDILNYSIDTSIFKGVNVNISTNINKDINEKEFYNFRNGIFNLKKKDFFAGESKIYVKKNIFSQSKNDPRIYGLSSKKIGNITKINKGVFTSCQITDGCSPWSIKATEIIHDEKKKDIIYKNPILRLYDIPIIYFPKFIHADPTVKRRSGFIQPSFQNSKILGSSVSTPYFYALSDNADFTLNPTIFDSDIYMARGEYRQKEENSNFIADFGFTKGYRSSTTNDKENSISHIFSHFNKDLNYKNFNLSDLEISFQKTNKDTYLKVFDNNLTDLNKNIKPNSDKLLSSIKLNLDHTKFNFDTGILSYENLNGSNNDKYQYVLPYYNFSKEILSTSLVNLSFQSNGNNNLKETNKVKSIVKNDFLLNSINFFSNFGIKNNFKILMKNVNTVGKNEENYESSPETNLRGIVNLESSLPLVKTSDKFFNMLTPKISVRANPNNMKNNSNAERIVNVDNIFNINRLGLTDTVEAGNSLTLGLDYTKESTQDLNKFFELKFAGILRDAHEENIPLKSGINQKTSNLFGSAKYNLSEELSINYDFSIDNDLNTFERNKIGGNLTIKNFYTNISFIENNGKLGSSNVLENTLGYDFNDENSLLFRTRRNKEINLTEYYDLVYQYKNDCLVAGIKYKKTFYEDRELKPSEDLFFTISFFPITQFEQKIDQDAFRN
jgi:LPS-assembly protein